MTSTGKRNWVNALNQLVNSYNDTYSKSLGMTPRQASLPENSDKVFHRKFHKLVTFKQPKPKFSLNQPVRFALSKMKLGDKSYTKNYSDEIFYINSIILGVGPIRYKIRDSRGQILNTSFYEPELSLQTHVQPSEN